MQVQIQPVAIQLSDSEFEYLKKKFETLKRFDVRVDDPSTKINVRVERTDVKTSDSKVKMEATLHFPGAHLRAETSSKTVQEGADILEEKLRKQIQKYKTKRLKH